MMFDTFTFDAIPFDGTRLDTIPPPPPAGLPSLREAIYTHFAGLTALAESLAGGAVEFARIPQEEPRPALTFAVISDVREWTLDGPLTSKTARVRFTASGPDPVQNVEVLAAVEAELEQLRALAGSVPVLFALPDEPNTGNDEEPASYGDGSDAPQFGASLVYRIRYRTRLPD